MRCHGLNKVGQHWPLLEAQRLHHREDSFGKAAALLAGAAEGVLAPQHPAAQQPFRVVVRREKW
jgi:hypothetical protein